MSNQYLELGRRGFVPQLADVVSEARRLIGWSQRELAHRAQTSQATIWRIERGRSEHLDLLATERVLTALGIRATLQLDARHLEDRRRQQDAVHARINGYIARRLERDAWRPATEVPIGDGVPRGWIDILAFRDADSALLVEESKTEIPDFGALQRSLAFYQREAPFVARRLGWKPRRVVVLVAALDS
ncbi:MAG TPA: helix-turn-helix transcriptional regulator, partial [Candidatus Limnocylindrales bacterium]